jgi:acyl-coenzyme A thioesterase 13
MAPHHVTYLKAWMDQMNQFASRIDEEGPMFLHDCFSRSVVVEADDDSATFEYTVRKSDCNFSDNFHGGAMAALIDNLTTAALFTRERKLPLSLSLEMDVDQHPK